MRVVDLHTLTDSRIQYEKRPPLFGLLIVALTAAGLVAALVWASVTPRPSIVEAAGSIEGANRSLVMSSVSGRITEVVAPNGSTVDAGARLIAVESVELEVEKQTVAAQRTLLQSRLDLEARFAQAVRAGTNPFGKDVAGESTYYWRLDSLKKQKAQLRVNRAGLAAQGYTPEEIDNAVASNRLKAEELDADALSESGAAEAELRAQIGELDIREQAATTGESAFQVAAPVAGTVYLDEVVQVGSVVNAGDPIGSVASTEEGVEVKAYLSVSDRQNVEVGDRARVSVSGLPSVDYDTLDGTIVSIDADVTTVQTGVGEPSTYFVARVALEDDVIRSHDGERHALLNGTAISVALVHHEITYLEYVAELIGLDP